MADVYTGADDELDEIVEEAWISGSPSGVLDLTKVWAWRDAAVAKHLAEAGAVHPAVHTPNRVMQWLEQHGWERFNVSDIAVCWERWPRRVYIPTNAETVDYSRRVIEALRDAAFVDEVAIQQVLAEIAALPDEWSW